MDRTHDRRGNRGYHTQGGSHGSQRRGDGWGDYNTSSRQTNGRRDSETKHDERLQPSFPFETDSIAQRTRDGVTQVTDKRYRFRRNVMCLVVCKEDPNLILACEGLGMRGWQTPQGGVDKGESVTKTAWRELFEEVGLEKKHGLNCIGQLNIPEGMTGVGPKGNTLRYLFPDGACKKWVKSGIIGQDQTPVVFIAPKQIEVQMDLSGNGGMKPEFRSAGWMTMPDFLKKINEHRKHIFIAVAKSLPNFLKPLMSDPETLATPKGFEFLPLPENLDCKIVDAQSGLLGPSPPTLPMGEAEGVARAGEKRETKEEAPSQQSNDAEPAQKRQRTE